MSLTVKAYAKLNLWLDITGKRSDGYHTLNTVMRRIDLYDDVTVETVSGSEITVTCSDPAIPDDERNIAYRAARAFCKKMNKDVGVHIRIDKRIPVGAGLGGSSADGAAVLAAMNEMCGMPLSVNELCELGAGLGADVPFCITGGTAKCTGIGDIMQPIGCADLAALVAVPDFSCSTAEAYRRYDDCPIKERTGFDEFCSRIGSDRSYIAGNMYNIFESLYNDNRIDNLKELLIGCGAEGACLTGSGSAVFGVFADIVTAQNAAEKLNGCRTIAVAAL